MGVLPRPTPQNKPAGDCSRGRTILNEDSDQRRERELEEGDTRRRLATSQMCIPETTVTEAPELPFAAAVASPLWLLLTLPLLFALYWVFTRRSAPSRKERRSSHRWPLWRYPAYQVTHEQLLQ